MLQLLSSPDHVLAYRISGAIETDDYDQIIAAVESKLRAHSKIGLYADVAAFTDISAQALAKDLRYSFSKIGEWGRFPRLALVTDKRWLKGLVSVLDPLFPQFEAKIFAPGEEAEAMSWAAEIPGAARAGASLAEPAKGAAGPRSTSRHPAGSARRH